LFVPTTTRRIEALDVLRGVAILGTLGTNIWIFTHPWGPPAVLSWTPRGHWWADHVELVLRFLPNGKLLALLTLLFGVGLELQYQSARPPRPALARLVPVAGGAAVRRGAAALPAGLRIRRAHGVRGHRGDRGLPGRPQ
jgi:uncharacterized membrane protein YeiB